MSNIHAFKMIILCQSEEEAIQRKGGKGRIQI